MSASVIGTLAAHIPRVNNLRVANEVGTEFISRTYSRRQDTLKCFTRSRQESFWFSRIAVMSQLTSLR